MIIVNCPECGRVQVFDWRPGMRPGYFPAKCAGCGAVMWTLGTSGETQVYSHEDFIKELVFSEDLTRIEAAAAAANVCSVTDRK